ncbi:MAG TPA: serine hydrolase, partial [Vicinamibacterales bacterium]|nr:serine hydrolase [Vicinamibacterales bacterium]
KLVRPGGGRGPALGTPAPGTPARGTPAPGTPALGTPAPGTPAPGTAPAGEYFSGAGGLTSTAQDYLEFCQMLLNGGTLNGTRLLSRKSVELMTADATPGLDLRNYLNGEQPLQGYGFGLGVRVRRNNGENGWLGSPGDFGWAGALGTYFWIDPKEELIGMVLMQTRVTRLRTEFPNAVYQAIVD